jgi:hypothetical protein
VKYFISVLSVMVAALLISVPISYVYANELEATVNAELDRLEASYIGVKTLTLRYPEGSSIAQELNGQDIRIQFTINGTSAGQNDTSLDAAIASINRALVQMDSPGQATDVTLSYTAALRGGPNSALISNRLEIEPIMESVVLGGEGGQEGRLVDLEWRGITVNGPIVVNAPEVGEINVNQPIGLFQALYPSLGQKLEDSQAREVLDDPILNFNDFNAPMGAWHFLFDPVGAYGSAFELEGTEGASTLSIYSLGEASFREGAHRVEEKRATAMIDGAEVLVQSNTPPPAGNIMILGYSSPQERGGAWATVVTVDAPEGIQTATGSFPIQVLLIFGGMMGAIAIFILFRARK